MGDGVTELTDESRQSRQLLETLVGHFVKREVPTRRVVSAASLGYESGYGVGGIHGHASIPTVSFGLLNAVGDLDKGDHPPLLQAQHPEAPVLLREAAAREARNRGTVTATFKISPDGTVASSSANGVDQAVSECVAGVIGGTEFPKPKDGGTVDVNYPLVFRSGEPAPAVKKPAHAPK